MDSASSPTAPPSIPEGWPSTRMPTPNARSSAETGRDAGRTPSAATPSRGASCRGHPAAARQNPPPPATADRPGEPGSAPAAETSVHQIGHPVVVHRWRNAANSPPLRRRHCGRSPGRCVDQAGSRPCRSRSRQRTVPSRRTRSAITLARHRPPAEADHHGCRASRRRLMACCSSVTTRAASQIASTA